MPPENLVKSRRPRILPAVLLCVAVSALVQAAEPQTPAKDLKRVAAVVTVYYHNSHADVIVGRLLQSYTLDGKGEMPRLKLVSLYTDQVPPRDISRRLAEQYKFPIYDTVADALTLGTGKLAVDGVLLVAEHGTYLRSATGQIEYPKRRLFEEVVKVFASSGRSVPVFSDKHLSDNWQDAQWIYRTSRTMNFPLMAGSSLPGLWRYPPADVKPNARLKEIVGVSYHTLDAYGFHGLEMLQCLAERRQGGEAGIMRVQCYEGDAVWKAGEEGIYDRALLDAALSRLQRPVRKDRTLAELVKQPVLFHIEYADGLKTNLLTLNGAVGEWSAAWRYADGREVESTLFYTQEARPFGHFTFLLQGVEKMMLTGQPAWPVERTLMTSGALDALLISKQQGGKPLDTPQLKFAYRSDWQWREPPPPPPDRPIPGP
jgi:hypothetical protein